MAWVKLISEEEATDRVKALYEEIKEGLGTDFVPNLYKLMDGLQVEPDEKPWYG